MHGFREENLLSSISIRHRILYWQADYESSPLADLGFKSYRTLVPIHDSRIGNGQSLAASFSGLFRREKRIKNFRLNFNRNPPAGIADPNLHPRVILASGY